MIYRATGSNETQVRTIFLLIAMFFYGFAAQGEDVPAAIQKQAKARNQYYKDIEKAKGSAEAEIRSRKKNLDPSNVAIKEAIRSDNDESNQELKLKEFEEVKGLDEDVVANSGESGGMGAENVGSTENEESGISLKNDLPSQMNFSKKKTKSEKTDAKDEDRRKDEDSQGEANNENRGGAR